MAVALPQQMGTNPVGLLEDGLHVALCGAGGPMPSPRASGPCVTVIAGNQLFLVDAGAYGPRNLAQLGYPLGGIDAAFLKHFHSDHLDGLGELATLRWATGDDLAPLIVHGAEGVEGVIASFKAAYAADFTYRHDNHRDIVAALSAAGSTTVPFKAPPDGELATIFNKKELNSRR